MCEGTNTKERTHYTESCKHNCQRFVLLAHTFFNIVHGTTGDITVVIHSTIFNCQQTFCVFSCHTKECCNPHPEQCTRTTHLNSSRYTNDVTGTNGSCQSSTQSFKATYVAFAFTFRTKDKFQSRNKFENLNKVQTDGKPDTGTN